MIILDAMKDKFVGKTVIDAIFPSVKANVICTRKFFETPFLRNINNERKFLSLLQETVLQGHVFQNKTRFKEAHVSKAGDF